MREIWALLPGGFTHTVDPDCNVVSGKTQSLHTFAPGAFEKEPMGHLEQAAEEGEKEKVPASQFRHTLAFVDPV